MSDLVHGTANAYKNRGCRCPACTAAAVAYQRAYKRRVRLEGPLTEPVEETREHLERLLSSGVSLAQVSRLTGLTTSNLRAIASGRTKRLRRRTVEAIEGIQLGTTTEALRVPGGKARRLIEAMGEAGIPAVVLGPGNIEQAHAENEWITLDQLQSAVDVYLRLMCQPLENAI